MTGEDKRWLAWAARVCLVHSSKGVLRSALQLSVPNQLSTCCGAGGIGDPAFLCVRLAVLRYGTLCALVSKHRPKGVWGLDKRGQESCTSGFM